MTVIAIHEALFQPKHYEFLLYAFVDKQGKYLDNPIKKTRLYSFDPLKPHFYIAIFLISVQKHWLWVLIRTASPRWF